MRTTKRLIGVAVILLIVVFGLSREQDRAWASSQIAAVTWQASGEVWVSEEIEGPLTLTGLTWQSGVPESVAVRYQSDGEWGPWSTVPIGRDHGPDRGTAEWENQKPGTDIVWAGESDAVQFMVTGNEAVNAEATLIDTTDRTKPLSRRISDLFDWGSEAAQGAPTQPTIHPRSDWDPSNTCAPKADPSLVQVTHAFVHHTTGSNTETPGQIPGHVLAICLYHTNSNGWDDIGYNFLIDRFGGIWEGRAGGITNGVQGAHAAGFNSYSTGIAFIGEHTSSAPSAAAEAALEQLIAWKFGVHNVDPTNASILVSKGSNKWVEGTPVLMKPISGHRDAQATSCPGDACYARIPTYRSAVDAAWNQVPLSLYQNPLTGDFDGDGGPEGAIFRATDGVWTVTQEAGVTSTWADYATSTGWGSQVVGDFNGDGKDDIANFHPGNGTWWVSRSTGNGFATSLWADYATSSGWQYQLPGDFDGDGKDDIANYYPGNGTWWVSRSTGNGFATSLWGVLDSFDHLSLAWIQNVDTDSEDEVITFDAYNGFIYRLDPTGTTFDIESLADTPWRTTLRSNQHHSSGDATLIFYGQEFSWIDIAGLDTSNASADVVSEMAWP